MKLLNVIAVILIVWQIGRLIFCLPSLLEAFWHKASGEERREIEGRQRVAIDRRIALMNEQLERQNADHLSSALYFQDARPDIRASVAHLHQHHLNLIRVSCDRDIEKIKKSYWGRID